MNQMDSPSRPQSHPPAATSAPATIGPRAAAIYGVVFCVGLACAMAIATVHEITRPLIQQNRVALRSEAILKVLPATVDRTAFRWDDASRTFRATAVDSEAPGVIFVGRDSAGLPTGVAIEAQGMGYQDTIRLLYGYSISAQAIVGIQILESRETPGLGDRIEKDPQFLKNFSRLEVTLDANGEQLAHPITFVSPGEKTDLWQVDGITGATISSRAVAEMLRASTAVWIPRIAMRKSDLLQASGEDL